MTACYGCEEEIRIPSAIFWGSDGEIRRPFCHEDCREETLSEPDGYEYCGDCGQRCQPDIRDYGIGAYEYWGFPGVDRHLCVVSTCCEGSVYGNPALAGRALQPDDAPGAPP